MIVTVAKLIDKSGKFHVAVQIKQNVVENSGTSHTFQSRDPESQLLLLVMNAGIEKLFAK